MEYALYSALAFTGTGTLATLCHRKLMATSGAYAAFRARWTRRAVAQRIGHWAFAWVAGDKAREAAVEGYYREAGK